MTSKHCIDLTFLTRRCFLEDQSRHVLLISKHPISEERKLVDSCEKTSQDYSSTVPHEHRVDKGAGTSMQDFFLYVKTIVILFL